MGDLQESIGRLHELRALHDALGGLFQRPLDPAILDDIRAALEAARAVEVGAPEGSKWALWEKHFRVTLDALDLTAILGATPAPGPAPEVAFISAKGDPLEARDVRARAAGAEVAFYAAGDEVYVRRYGPYYARSTLRKCDVPCLVMLHVIGGEGRLAGIAEALGIADDRLIYVVDRFDASAVKTRCYDAPPRGLMPIPVAHYQSVRFLTAGLLLELLDRPIFISDIDLLLQRGIRDLLDRTAAADVVLNENSTTVNLGAFVTANLVLVRPTAAAFAFLAFVRGYLERRLGEGEVSRWIDQLALLQARHHIARRPDARLGRFDADDINNRMMTTYHPNPYRFLSLYAGFDMASLRSLYPGAALAVEA